MAGSGQSYGPPMSPFSLTGHAFAKSATVGDFRRLSRQLTPEPSPQAWLASSKRRMGVLDPPASPLEMLSPITDPLDASQWNKRISLLTHRYLIEYGSDREAEIVQKAFRTLELFCVGNEARHSLETFKCTFARLFPTSPEQQTRNPLERSHSWISFPSFLDNSFNLSHTSLSLEQTLDGGTLSDITQDVNNRQSQALSHTSIPSGCLRPRENAALQKSESHTAMVEGPIPRYMTPTVASIAQNSTPPPQSRPATPASVASTTKGWMANAGRRLGITTPNSRREGQAPDGSSVGRHSPHDAAPVSQDSQVHEKSGNAHARKTARSLVQDEKREASNVHHIRLSRQREHTPPPNVHCGITSPLRRGSPPDKPLPSIPVATVRSSSPIIRRSLIDASEKPLRRSLSPSPGVEGHEEWPAIQPARPATSNIPTPSAQHGSVDSATADLQQCRDSTVKVQGSVPKKREEHNPLRARYHDPIHQISDRAEAALGATKVMDDGLAKEEEGAMEAGETQIRCGIHNAFPGTTPAEYRGNGQQTRLGRSPRQTRNSLMRARLSSDSNYVQDEASQADDQLTLLNHSSPPPPPHDSSTGNPSPVLRRLSIPGPVRSRSRSRRAVPVRDGPYGQSNRAGGRVLKMHMNASRLHASPARGKPSTTADRAGFSRLTAIRQIKTPGLSMRKSHIPVRHPSQGFKPEESKVDVCVKRLQKYVGRGDRDTNFEHAADGGIGTGRPASSLGHTAVSKNVGIRQVEREDTVDESAVVDSEMSCSSPAPPRLGRAAAAQTGIRPSASISSSSASEDDVSLSRNSLNDSSVMSLRDFAAIEPPIYRVKRLSLAAPEHGPTLRISEDAEKILMGSQSGVDQVAAEPRDSKRSSTPDLPKSIWIKDQFRVSKESILKVQLPLLRSATSASVSKLDSEQSRSTAAECSANDAETATTTDAAGGSTAHGSGPGHGTRNEDPFLVREVRPSGEHAAEPCLPKDEQWPLRCAEAPHPDLKTVPERPSEEEDSWISPMAAAVVQNKEGAATLAPKGPHSTHPANDPRDLHRPPTAVPRVQGRVLAPTPTHNAAEGTNSAEAHGRPPFPARISSRTQFREMVRDRSDTARPAPSPYSTDPEIPNRFASVRSSTQPKPISSTPASIPRSESVRRLNYSTSTNGFANLSTLRQRHAPDSIKTQLSSTRGMLSNFRGLFHKRSLEHAEAASATRNHGSVRHRHRAVGKSGSPFPVDSTPGSSTSLSAGLSRRNLRVTPTPGGIGGMGGNGAPRSISPAFIRQECGETRDAERLAVQVLDSALLETNGPKKTQLGQLGQIMVHAVTAAKDAEKAMEEARQAAAMAEVHSMDAKRCLWHVSEMVETLLQK